MKSKLWFSFANKLHTGNHIYCRIYRKYSWLPDCCYLAQTDFKLQLFRLREENAESLSRLQTAIAELKEKAKRSHGDLRDVAVSTEDNDTANSALCWCRTSLLLVSRSSAATSSCTRLFSFFSLKTQSQRQSGQWNPRCRPQRKIGRAHV